MDLINILSYAYTIIFFLPSLLIGFTVHEFSHAWAATKLGDYTAKSQGRLTLNPLAHIDPLGLISFIFVQIGWGKPVPINEYNFENPVLGTALVSVAGPGSNLLLALIGSIIFRVVPENYLALDFFKLFIEQFVIVNIALAIFNLLPIPPLDGYRIVRLFIPDSLRGMWESLERFSPIIFLLLIISSGGIIFDTVSSILRFITDFLLY